jgi:hypothetical protein
VAAPDLEWEATGKKDATCWRLTSPGTPAILRVVGCARGGSTLIRGSGAGRKTPDSPFDFILIMIPDLLINDESVAEFNSDACVQQGAPVKRTSSNERGADLRQGILTQPA